MGFQHVHVDVTQDTESQFRRESVQETARSLSGMLYDSWLALLTLSRIENKFGDEDEL